MFCDLNFFYSRVASASPTDVVHAIEDANEAFKSGTWSKSSAIFRSTVLSRLARALESRIPDLARVESLQTGRTLREMNAQLGRLPEWLWGQVMLFLCTHLNVFSDYYAALLRTHQAFVAPTQGKLLNYVQRVPLGVVAQITVRNDPILWSPPWNLTENSHSTTHCSSLSRKYLLLLQLVTAS